MPYFVHSLSLSRIIKQVNSYARWGHVHVPSIQIVSGIVVLCWVFDMSIHIAALTVCMQAMNTGGTVNDTGCPRMYEPCRTSNNLSIYLYYYVSISLWYLSSFPLRRMQQTFYHPLCIYKDMKRYNLIFFFLSIS